MYSLRICVRTENANYQSACVIYSLSSSCYIFHPAAPSKQTWQHVLCHSHFGMWNTGHLLGSELTLDLATCLNRHPMRKNWSEWRKSEFKCSFTFFPPFLTCQNYLHIRKEVHVRRLKAYWCLCYQCKKNRNFRRKGYECQTCGITFLSE
jgi:hypothetical protein